MFPCKSDSRDLLRLRYHRPVPGLPSRCICLEPYSVEHSQRCVNGGSFHQRHNEAQELFAFECQRAGLKDIELEPLLLPIQTSQTDGWGALRCASQRFLGESVKCFF